MAAPGTADVLLQHGDWHRARVGPGGFAPDTSRCSLDLLAVTHPGHHRWHAGTLRTRGWGVEKRQAPVAPWRSGMAQRAGHCHGTLAALSDYSCCVSNVDLAANEKSSSAAVVRKSR